jgi:predicted PurR-regulated permease PerM
MKHFLLRTGPATASASAEGIASALVIAVVVIAFLYLGRPILEPLVIATLLAFILSPVIRRLRAWGLWRTPAVVLSVLGALALIGLLSATIVLQITELAEDLPKYETTLREKIRALGAAPLTSSILDRASGTLHDLQQEIARDPAPKAEPRPLPVEVRQPEPKGLEAIARLITPLLSPLATTGLVILFLLFLLLQRDDIRDRLLRLAGTADLQRSTAALDDAATRLSRFFLMQTLLNLGFGIIIGTCLWLIGIPNAVLWGIVAGLMRFVPFVGGVIAAFFPVALAAAVDPGWSLVLLTIALFVVAEPLAGNVVEPLVHGQHTGLSPVAIVIAALFWTMLWGPIGLLLATPLTVCLVVLGRHIDALQFLEILLGDEPALQPHERFYQRILASDATEAADQAEQQLKSEPLSAYYDKVPMQALMLAQSDAARGKLTREKQQEVRDTIEEAVGYLADYSDEVTIRDEQTSDAGSQVPVLSRAQLPDDWQMPYPVLCIASRSALDEAACLMLADALDKHGISAWVQPFPDVASAKHLKVDTVDARLVCLSYFGAIAKPAHVRYLIRRLKRVMPHAQFLAGFWMLREHPDRIEEWRKAVGADLATSSLSETVALIVGTVIKAGPQNSGSVTGPISDVAA